MIHNTNPSSDRRQRKREARKANFVDLAYSIVEKEGLDRLTMPKLAQAADVAVGGLYRYFSNKEALIAALQIRASVEYRAFVDAQLSVESAPGPVATILAIAGSWRAFALHAPEQFQLLDGSLSSPEALLSDSEAQEVATSLQPVFERCAAHFQEAVEAELLTPGDPMLRTFALWAAIHGVGHFHKRDRIMPESLHATAVRQELVQSLLVGWGASRDQLGE